MYSSSRWAQGQKATPSFVTAAGEAPTVLDTPVPQVLRRYHSPRAAERGTPRARAHSADASRRGAAALGSPHTIFEDLVDRGKLQQQRKEGLIEKAIIQERKQCRPVPKVSEMAANLQRTGHIVQRLLKKKREQDKAMKFQLMEIDSKDKKVLDSYFTPKISGRGTRAVGKSRSQIEGRWDFRKKERLEELRRQAIMKELEQVQESPDINPKSAALAARQRERQGLSGYSHFEAMIERDRLAKMELFERRQAEIARLNSGNPKITAMALGMNRSIDDVGDRLYQDAAEVEARRLERERARLEEEEKLRKSANSNRTPVTPRVAEDLLERHNRYMAKRNEKIEAIRELEKQQHTPVINPVSDVIASRLPQSTMERLSTPRRQAVHSVTSPGSARPHKTGPYESPAHGSLSPEGAPVKSAGEYDEKDAQVFQRMMVAEERRQARLRAARELQERRAMEECSFKPATSPTMQSYAQPSAPDSIYERSQMWARRRELRLQQQRQELEEAQRRECTFEPEVPDIAYGEADAPLSETAGFAEFMQRQESARKKAVAALSESKDHPGAPIDWSPSATVPREFIFAQSPGEIQSLHRPIDVPRRNVELVAAARSEIAPSHEHGAVDSPGVAKALAARLIMENRQRQFQYQSPGNADQLHSEPVAPEAADGTEPSI